MKDKNRIAIGIVVLGLLMPLIAIGAWKLEMNRGSCSEARAKEAMENGDWELAAAYAEKADIEELRLETAYKVARSEEHTSELQSL